MLRADGPKPRESGCDGAGSSREVAGSPISRTNARKVLDRGETISIVAGPYALTRNPCGEAPGRETKPPALRTVFVPSRKNVTSPART